MEHRRDVLAATVLRHWPTNSAGCSCGELWLGHSYPMHLADQYEAALASCGQCGAPRHVLTVQDAEGRRAVLVCTADATHGPDKMPA